jgi:lambda family phage portal protein
LSYSKRKNNAENMVKNLENQARIQQAKAQIEISKAKVNVMRSFNNSGYSESGASRNKKALKGWDSTSRTPLEDIDFNLDLLRQRSRSLYMSAPIATSAIKTQRTNVIGSGLKLKCKIDYEFLGITKEVAEKWEKNTEREFELWAKSVWCDTQRLNNFYELQQLALMSWLINGDGFTIIKHTDRKPWMPYSLRLHLIEGDRVCNPNTSLMTSANQTTAKAANGNKIYNGIEIDKDGAVTAYHICNQYPNSNIQNEAKKWQRVDAYGELTGEPNILHLMESERCEQYRGVPYLAPVIETLKQITRYTEAELMAAVVQSFFTAFIKVDTPKNELPLGNMIPIEEQIETDANSYELGAGTINVLGPNEDVVFGDPTRPSSGFDPFVTAMSKHIGAALEIPFELLTKSFMASYSASRAALLEAWKAFRMRRTWFADDFCQPVYELFLSEAVALGRINAPGYFNDPSIKKAWCNANWNGPSPGQIDPVKEVNAATLRVEQGYSTRERETIELTGGNWDENIVQIKRENQLLNDAQPLIPITETNSKGGK